MKKKILLFATLLLFGSISFAQTLYRTYYDYEKQHVHEEYYANSYGVKNGIYKEYSEYGGVLQEGTYKEDKKTGKWTTMNEKGKLSKVETYKDDNLNGPYISYYDNGGKYKEGNFADDKPIGNWYIYLKYQNFINNYIKYIRIDDNSFVIYYDYVPASVLVGCEYVKILVHIQYFDEDNRDTWDDNDWGHIINTYYPSGKKCQEGHYNHGAWIGDYYQYYPNGNLEGFWELDTIQGKELFSKGWAWPGGNKDSIQFYKKAEIAERHGQDSLQQATNRQQESEQRRHDSLSNIERRKQERSEDSAQKAYQNQMAEQQRKETLNQRVDSLYRAYKNLYVGSKQSTLLGVPLVDQKTHQPVIKTTYLHGEYLFEKSDTLIKSMWMDCKNTQDISSQIVKLNSITTLINKLISMANTDTKDIDKQMKKAETMGDIKKILNFEY